MSNSSSRFIRAFLASVLGTGLSRILGAARDIAIAGFLGAGAVSDSFLIAFTIPNTFRRFVADEGLTGALIPAIARAEGELGTEQAKQLANTAFTALLLANIVIVCLGIWGAEWVVKAFAYAFSRDVNQFALTVDLTRWLFPFVAFVSLVSFSEGLLNHRGHFFIPKVAPGVVSAGMVGGIVFFGTSFEQPVYALVAGTLVGGLAHALVVLPPLLSLWGRVGLRFTFGEPRFRALFKEMGKVLAIGLFAQINILAIRQLAASLESGSVTWYWNATRLVDLSQGIIAVAIGSALLPTVSQAVAEGDWERVERDLLGALRLAAFLVFPAAAVLAGFSEPVTAILFRHGRYTWPDVQWTALTVLTLVPFLLSVAGINILKKVFYAVDDRNSLLWVGAVGVALTAGLGVVCVSYLSLPGLGIALSLSTSIQLVVYVVLLHRKMGDRVRFLSLLDPLLRMGAASAGVGLLLHFLAGMTDWSVGLTLKNGLSFGLSLAAAIFAYTVLSLLLRISELERIVSRLRGRFRR